MNRTFLLAAGLLCGATLLGGCAGNKPPNLNPCDATRAGAAVVCLAQPSTPACDTAKAAMDAACGTPPALVCKDGEVLVDGKCQPKLPPPPPPGCPESCPAGQHCTDPKLGCVADVPPPPAAGCSIDGEPGAPIDGWKNALGPWVNVALTEVTHCTVGGTCLLGDIDQQTFIHKVVERLKRPVTAIIPDPDDHTGARTITVTKTLCSGQHIPGETDEVAVAIDTKAPREGFHVFAGDDHAGPVPSVCYDKDGKPVQCKRRTVVWSPQAARGAYSAPSGPPPPPPPPPPSSCEAVSCTSEQHCEQGKGCVAGRACNSGDDCDCWFSCGMADDIGHCASRGYPWKWRACSQPPAVDLSPLPNRQHLKVNLGGLYCYDEGDASRCYRDATVLSVGDGALCLAYGFTDGRLNCAMGPDKTPQRWGRERYAFGQDDLKAQPPGEPGPAVCNSQPPGLARPNPANWIQCGCVQGQCEKVQVCTKDGNTCSKWEVLR